MFKLKKKTLWYFLTLKGKNLKKKWRFVYFYHLESPNISKFLRQRSEYIYCRLGVDFLSVTCLDICFVSLLIGPIICISFTFLSVNCFDVGFVSIEIESVKFISLTFSTKACSAWALKSFILLFKVFDVVKSIFYYKIL